MWNQRRARIINFEPAKMYNSLLSYNTMPDNHQKISPQYQPILQMFPFSSSRNIFQLIHPVWGYTSRWNNKTIILRLTSTSSCNHHVLAIWKMILALLLQWMHNWMHTVAVEVLLWNTYDVDPTKHSISFKNSNEFCHYCLYFKILVKLMILTA